MSVYDRKVLHKMSYGLYVVTTEFEGKINGQIADAVMQINAAPRQTVALSLNNDNYTTELVKQSGKLAVSILSQNYDPALIANFGLQSGRTADKFAVFPPKFTAAGLPYYEGSGFCGWVAGSVIEQMTVGSHTIFVIEAEEGMPCSDTQPLLYADYLAKKTRPAAQTAPAFVGDTPRWRCKMCGYIYEGELPPDYRCPICGVGADMFERV